MATMTLDELVAQLQKAFGDSLRAAVLYGSATAGEHIAKRSDHNVLVIVDALDLAALQREAAVASAWAEAGNPPPLTLTMAEWRSSADIFAMEYADILDHHRVLFGEPPFDGLQVDPRDLRLQLERESAGTRNRLRQGVLAAANDRKKLLKLLTDSLSTFMVLFRATLRLHGRKAPIDYEALSKETAALAGFSAEPFVRVVLHLRGTSTISEQEVTAVLAEYLAGARQLAAHVDQVQTP